LTDWKNHARLSHEPQYIPDRLERRKCFTCDSPRRPSKCVRSSHLIDCVPALVPNPRICLIARHKSRRQPSDERLLPQQVSLQPLACTTYNVVKSKGYGYRVRTPAILQSLDRPVCACLPPVAKTGVTGVTGSELSMFGVHRHRSYTPTCIVPNPSNFDREKTNACSCMSCIGSVDPGPCFCDTQTQRSGSCPIVKSATVATKLAVTWP
jgi:hypothetical protein